MPDKVLSEMNGLRGGVNRPSAKDNDNGHLRDHLQNK